MHIPSDYILKEQAPLHLLPKDWQAKETQAEPPVGYHKLYIEGGHDILPGFTNLNSIGCGVEKEIVHPLLSFPWPIEDNTVLEIFIGPIICELPLNVFGDFMQECWRVLVSSGQFKLKAPYYTSMAYWCNPRNRLPITDETFVWYSQRILRDRKITSLPNCSFSPLRCVFIYSKEWEMRADSAKEWARRHYWNVVDVVEITLKAVKPLD